MAKEKQKSKPSSEVWKLYKVEGSSAHATHEACPKCGPGVFLAKHNNRLSCGRCGYTVFAGKK